MCKNLFLSLQLEPKWHENGDESSVQRDDDCQTLAVSNPQELVKNQSHTLIPPLNTLSILCDTVWGGGKGGSTCIWVILPHSTWILNWLIWLSQIHQWSTATWIYSSLDTSFKALGSTSSWVTSLCLHGGECGTGRWEHAFIIFQNTQPGISSLSLRTVSTCRKVTIVSRPVIFTVLLKKKKEEKSVCSLAIKLFAQ